MRGWGTLSTNTNQRTMELERNNMSNTKPQTRTEFDIISIHGNHGCVVNEKSFAAGQQVSKTQWTANDLEEAFQTIAESDAENFTVTHCSGSVEFVRFSEMFPGDQ